MTYFVNDRQVPENEFVSSLREELDTYYFRFKYNRKLHHLDFDKVLAGIHRHGGFAIPTRNLTYVIHDM